MQSMMRWCLNEGSMSSCTTIRPGCSMWRLSDRKRERPDLTGARKEGANRGGATPLGELGHSRCGTGVLKFVRRIASVTVQRLLSFFVDIGRDFAFPNNNCFNVTKITHANVGLCEPCYEIRTERTRLSTARVSSCMVGCSQRDGFARGLRGTQFRR
jgi:hypothetical protein